MERFRLIDNKVSELREINLLAVGYLLEADADLHKALVEERSMLFLNAGAPDFKESITRHQQNRNCPQKIAGLSWLGEWP